MAPSHHPISSVDGGRPDTWAARGASMPEILKRARGRLATRSTRETDHRLVVNSLSRRLPTCMIAFAPGRSTPLSRGHAHRFLLSSDRVAD